MTSHQSLDRVSVQNVHFVVSAGEDVGLDAAQLLREAGIEEDEVADPNARIDYVRVSALWHASARLAGDEAYGLHLAERLQAHHYGVLGIAVRASPTARSALDLLVDFTRRALPDTEIRVLTEEGRARFQHRYLGDPRRATRYVADLLMANFVVAGRGFIGLDFDPIEVHFRHAEQEAASYLDEYERIFRAPVEFGAVANCVIFDDRLLDRPMVKSDPELLAVIRTYAEEFLDNLAVTDDLSERARREIATSLVHGEPTVATTAAALGVSARTLQRQLRHEGTTHSELLDGVRRDLALELLERPAVRVDDVAEYVGFSDVTAFHRAFRRWTGTTPTAHRRRTRLVPGGPRIPAPRPPR